VVDCFVKIVFVKTTENKSVMFTKNMNGEAYDDNIDNYIVRSSLIMAEQHRRVSELQQQSQQMLSSHEV
jgi:uncharacterized protein YeeX (DUF496 family)